VHRSAVACPGLDVTTGTATADDREALYALGRQAFGADAPYDPDAPTVPDERVRVARVDGRPVAKVAAWRFGQWIAGASIPMAGISGVTASPHVARRGIVRRLLAEALREAAARREPIAALYPTTATLYRSVGFEMAGTWAKRALPASELWTGGVDGIDVEPADVTAVLDDRAAYDRQAGASNGWLDRPDLLFARHRHDLERQRDKRPLQVYRAVRDGRTVAVGAFVTRRPTSVPGRLYDLDAHQLWGDADGIRALAGTVAGLATTCGELATLLPRHVLGALTPHPHHAHVSSEWQWMLRLLDLPAALAARPAPAFNGAVHLRVHDPLLPANDGPWVLRHRDGAIHAEPGGRGSAEIAVTDLAALFTGFQTPHHLASAGALRGADAAALARLTTAFRGTEPTMVDFF
jgi:predicted acetyltransferase